MRCRRVRVPTRAEGSRNRRRDTQIRARRRKRVAPWVARVERHLAPGLSRDVATHRVWNGADVNCPAPDRSQVFCRAQVHVARIRAGKGGVTVGKGVPARQDNPLTVEVVATTSHALTLDPQQRRIKGCRLLNVAHRDDKPEQLHR